LTVFLVKFAFRLADGWPIRRTIAVCYVRSLRWLSFDQVRSINISTGEKVKDFCRATGYTCSSVDVPSNSSGPGAILHYIRIEKQPKARLLLYFHGGAYVSPADIKGQLPFALDSARAGALDLAVLEYTLAPELKYPGQLVQAADALDYILRTHDSSQIILGGDSAGGHLVLSLLAHIKKPNPHAKPLPGLRAAGQRLRGAYLISPWVAMKYDSSSFQTNASRDYIRAKSMATYTTMWKPDTTQVWAEPVTGGSQFWRNIPVDDLLITAGSWECFLDDIQEMASQLDAKPFGSGASVELSIGEKEVHVQCAVDKAVNVKNGKVANDILQWLASLAKEDAQ
jgi:acetyl esterase/lipase